MKQKIKQTVPTNPFIMPSEQVLTEITRDILDVQKCLDTNTVIIKKPFKDTKQNKIEGSKSIKLKTLKDIPENSLSGSEEYNEVEKFTSEMSESIQSNILSPLKKTNEYVNSLAKSTIQKSSGALYRGKDAIAENTPKASKPISKFLRRLFDRKKSLDQKDLDLLKRLAELKEEGILSPKEFALKKRQILEKL